MEDFYQRKAKDNTTARRDLVDGRERILANKDFLQRLYSVFPKEEVERARKTNYRYANNEEDYPFFGKVGGFRDFCEAVHDSGAAITNYRRQMRQVSADKICHGYVQGGYTRTGNIKKDREAELRARQNPSQWADGLRRWLIDKADDWRAYMSFTIKDESGLEVHDWEKQSKYSRYVDCRVSVLPSAVWRLKRAENGKLADLFIEKEDKMPLGVFFSDTVDDDLLGELRIYQMPYLNPENKELEVGFYCVHRKESGSVFLGLDATVDGSIRKMKARIRREMRNAAAA